MDQTWYRNPKKKEKYQHSIRLARFVQRLTLTFQTKESEFLAFQIKKSDGY